MLALAPPLAAGDGVLVIVGPDPYPPPPPPPPPFEPASRPLSASTLIFGCERRAQGPTLLGWCAGDEQSRWQHFYGPLYVGGLLYTGDRNIEVYGLGQLGLVNMAKKYRGALRIGLFNSARDASNIDIALVSAIHHDMFGIQLAAVAFADELRGIQLGLVALNDDRLYGFQLGVAAMSEDVAGVQLGVVTHVKQWVKGTQIGAFNIAKTLYGVQAGAINLAGKQEGLQIGVINVANRLEGVQIGVINIAAKGAVPLLPLFNFGW